MLGFIADQRKLLKQAVSLRVDIDFFVKSIEADQAKPNEIARTTLLEGIFDFLGAAIGLDEVRDYLNSSYKSNIPTQAKKGPIRLPAVALHVHEDKVELNARQRLAIASAGTAPGSPGSVKSAVKALNVAAAALPPNQDNKPLAKFKQQPKNLNALGIPIDPPISAKAGGHCLIISNVPRTLLAISSKVCGGPLERLSRNPDDSMGVPSFLVNFVNREVAVAYLQYSKTSLGRENISVSGRRFFVRWHADGDFQNPMVLKAARDPINPARRTLIFRDWSIPTAAGHRKKLTIIMKDLDPRFSQGFEVEECRLEPRVREMHAIFNCIEAAITVMAYHNCGLLGPDYQGCKIVFGKDPCDRKFPGEAGTVPLPTLVKSEKPKVLVDLGLLGKPTLDLTMREKPRVIVEQTQLANSLLGDPTLPEKPTLPVGLKLPAKPTLSGVSPTLPPKPSKSVLPVNSTLPADLARTLNFSNYPWNVTTPAEVHSRLEKLEERFPEKYRVVQFNIFPHLAQAVLVFNEIGAALEVLRLHKEGLLGPEFENTQAAIGGSFPVRPDAVPIADPGAIMTGMAPTADTTPVPEHPAFKHIHQPGESDGPLPALEISHNTDPPSPTLSEMTFYSVCKAPPTFSLSTALARDGLSVPAAFFPPETTPTYPLSEAPVTTPVVRMPGARPPFPNTNLFPGHPRSSWKL